MSDRFSLAGKSALITGGSRGLGHAMALAFAEAGADVAVVSRKLDACEATAREVERHYQDHIQYVAVNDPFVALNINTPDDYAELLTRIS